MKTCRTLNGLLKSLQEGKNAYLNYINMAKTEDGYIIYQTNGNNLIISENTYEIIKNNLIRKEV